MNNNYMGMNIELLKIKWQSIEDTYNNDNPWVFIVLDEVCVPRLNIAINDKKNRCILLKTNSSNSQNIKTVIKENIKFSYSKVYKQFVLELLDDSFLDLFDDLIISIYNKIHQETNDREAASIFADTIVKWMNFFIKGGNDKLSESIIRGLFGELIVLKDYLTTLDKLNVNEVLKAWQGPYNSPTDFVFDNSLVEVKTKRSDASIVKISSEFQLEEVSGKSLILKVVSIEDLVAFRMKHDSLISKKECFNFNTRFGEFKLHAFQQTNNNQVHIALIKGDWEENEPSNINM